MKRTTIAAIALLLGIAGCTENSALGNDREAQLDPPPSPPERATAASLLEIEPGLLKPEPFSDPELASLSLGAGACLFRYTEVGFPVFAFPYDVASPATIKLNGKLIELPPTGPSTWSDAGVRVEFRFPEGPMMGGQTAGEMIVRLDGAPDELGFRGAVECGT